MNVIYCNGPRFYAGFVLIIGLINVNQPLLKSNYVWSSKYLYKEYKIPTFDCVIY